MLPKASFPGKNTPLGDKRALRLLVVTLHGLSAYTFDSDAASEMEEGIWRQLQGVLPRLDRLVSQIEAISQGTLRERWTRPALTSKQRRRHERNYPRRAGSRFKRR